MGRNRLSESSIPDGKVSCSFNMDKTTHAKLRMACLFMECKQSEVIEKALKYYLKVKSKEWKMAAVQEMKKLFVNDSEEE